MATYLQGVTDYVPQVQPWRPNYNFYQPIFQQKQAKYDQGWNKVNNMYNSVLNAPMLREDNKLRRDDFFNNAQNQIKQLSGVDLSLAQNVDAAAQVFAPFYEDEGIVKDMGFTKKYQDEMQRAEYLRNCTDPKKCGDKYWSGGVRAMNYQAEDFINASAEDALKIAAPKYTEYYNLMKNAQAAIKDAGLSMKITSKNGQYLVTTKNGSQLTMPLMNFMMSRFGDDPRLQEFYSTKAMLLTRENPEAANKAYFKAMQNPGMSQEQVEQESQDEAFTQTYGQARSTIAGTANREENRFMNMVKKNDVLKARIRKNGIVPGSPEANEFLASVRDANMQEGVVEDLNNMNTAATNTDGSLQELGLAANKDQMRNVIANAMKINDMYNTANTLAYKDYERTMVADPFELQNNSFNNSMKLTSVKNNFALQKQAYDYIYKKGLKELDAAVTNGSTGTSINWWSRPSNNYSDRLNQFYQTGDASGQAPTPDATTLADQLATNILAGMSNPMSYVSTQPEKIAMLIQEGRFTEANQIAQGNVVQGNAAYDPASPVGTGVLFNKPPKTIQEISYDWTKAGDGVNIMKSTLARFARLNTVAANDGIPFNERGGVGSIIDHSWLTIDQMTEAFSGARGYTAEQINKWKTSSTEEKTRINKEILNTQFNIAGDETNPESDAMQLEMLDLTSHIDANFKHWGRNGAMRRMYGGDISEDYDAYSRMMNAGVLQTGARTLMGVPDFPQLTAEEFKTMRTNLPTNYNATSSANAQQFRKIKNIGIDKLIAMSGGNDGLFQFNEDAGGIWTLNDESPNAASRLTIRDESERPADELMSHSDYSKYNNLRQEEAGNLNEDGTYINPTLNPEMIDKLNRYEQFTGSTNFERKWGVGSEIPGMQFLNATHAAYKVNIANQDAGAQNAIDKFNTGLNNSANQLNPQTTSIDGRIWNAIKDKIVIQGGEGELSRLATKSELNGILAESIPELLSDPARMQSATGVTGMLHGKWGLNFKEFKSENMNDGKTSTKSMLNLLSVSNYASQYGASKGMFSGYSRPDFSTQAKNYNYAIAGLKMYEDSKLPFEERKYTNMNAALVETRQENPYTRQTGMYDLQTVDNTVSYGRQAGDEQYDTKAQEFLQFLGKYGDAIKTEYTNKGGQYNISPNNEMYTMFKNQSDPSVSVPSRMTFDMGQARIDEAWINVFEDHENTIGTAYEELLNNFTNQESSFGGMFTGDDGTPVGQGTMVAAPGTMKAVGPSRKNQNYFDSQYILDEGVKRGDFGTDIYGATILNELSASLKTVTSYSKGKEPLWDLKVHPMSGEYGTTKYTLEFLNPKWLEEQGYNKTKSGDIIEDTKRPMSYTWTVENATDPLSIGAHPTAWDATIGSLGTGETYTNTALQKDYGNIHYRKTDDGAIQPGYTIDLFNPESGEEEEISFYAPSQAYYGTDWIEQQINLVDEMIQAKAISEDTKRQYTMLRGIKNPDELLQNMAEQFGVTVEELLQSFN